LPAPFPLDGRDESNRPECTLRCSRGIISQPAARGAARHRQRGSLRGANRDIVLCRDTGDPATHA